MPAPDYATIYDFETQIEGVWKDILTTQLAGLVTSVSISRENTIADNPRVEIELIIGGFLSQRKGTSGPYREIPMSWEGELRVLIITGREVNAALHGQIRGLTRFCLSAQANFVNSTNLPYLQIMEMLPNHGAPSITDNLQEDITTVSYRVWFAINNSAWPS